MSFRRVFVSYALVAFAAATFGASAPVALADPVSTAATITKMEMSVVARVCQASRLGPGAMSGTASKVPNMAYAVRCYSISNQLFSCINLASEAEALLDIERTGQKTFAEMATEVDNEGGPNAANAVNGLSLAETAPVNVSPDQLALDIYKQCSSYVTATNLAVPKALTATPKSLPKAIHTPSPDHGSVAAANGVAAAQTSSRQVQASQTSAPLEGQSSFVPDCSQYPRSAPAYVLSAYTPVTPLKAQQQGIAGEVDVMISLDENSRQDAEPVITRSASDLLNGAAIDAARRSTFQTEIVGCRPIKSKAVFVIDFMSP